MNDALYTYHLDGSVRFASYGKLYGNWISSPDVLQMMICVYLQVYFFFKRHVFSWLCTKSVDFIISGGGSEKRSSGFWAISQILQSFDIRKPKDGKSAV